MKFRIAAFAAGVAWFAGLGVAQWAISTRAGLIHYTEGRVWAAGRPLEPNRTKFEHLNPGEKLQTGDGRAELVLAPGRMLRIGQYSELELISDELTAVELRLSHGAFIIDWVQEENIDGSVTVFFADRVVEIQKHGRYRLEADPGRTPALTVYDGKAVVLWGDRKVSVGDDKRLALSGAEPEPYKSIAIGDDLDRWSSARSLVVRRDTRAGEKGGRRRGRGFGDGRGSRGRDGPPPLGPQNPYP